MTALCRSRGPLLAGLSAALLVACGGGDRELDADEFVAEANRAGARIALGPPLPGASPEGRTFAVSLGGSDRASGGHGSTGSLLVAEDGSAALDFYRRCSRAPALVCYRAANVVLYHEEEADAEHARRIERAILAMAEP